MKRKRVATAPREDQEQVRAERDAAEGALLREYDYHMLRAEELKIFLADRGIQVD